MTTFVDTNILISLLDDRHVHHVWSTTQFQHRKTMGPVIICDIVYCEFSIGMTNQAAVDMAVSTLALERFGRNDQALFQAGRAYKKYRQNQGLKTGVLPDFLIGAIAEVMGAPLLTVNDADFSGYFPSLQLIAP